MISAELTAVKNEAGARLKSLRLKEVTYYSDRFSSIGTQTTLISGFIVGVLSVYRPLDNSPEGSVQRIYFVPIYFISAAIALVFAVHATLCSTFIGLW